MDFDHYFRLSVMCPTVLYECFSKPGAYITHNATQPLSDITGNLSDNMELPLNAQKDLYYKDLQTHVNV